MRKLTLVWHYVERRSV